MEGGKKRFVIDLVDVKFYSEISVLTYVGPLPPIPVSANCIIYILVLYIHTYLSTYTHAYLYVSMNVYIYGSVDLIYHLYLFPPYDDLPLLALCDY